MAALLFFASNCRDVFNSHIMAECRVHVFFSYIYRIYPLSKYLLGRWLLF